MGDAQQAPVIQLDIDQELFIDVVRDGDMVEDATVATEVTSLDHVGDTYVLEGAIVFTGTLRQQAPSEASAAVNSVEHRLPFLLRVPSKTQPRGIVNVASRISSWRLQVVGENWIQLEADLQVSGLNGKHGFHFQCGSQEFGNLLFEGSPLQNSTSVGVDVRANEAVTPEHDVADMLMSDEPTLEFIPPVLEDVEAATYGDSFDAHQDLADYDRAMEGDPIPTRGMPAREPLDEAGATELTSNTHAVPEEEKSDAATFRSAEGGPTSTPVEEVEAAEPEPAYSSFEFEHQVSAEDADIVDAQVRTAAPVDLPFSAARSFSDSGFTPHVGFGAHSEPAYRGEVTVSTTPSPSQGVESEELAEGRDVFDEGTGVPSTLWSFVDFNQPERAFTLRYVVVMDDETLEAVSDRLGCRPQDLMAANRLETEEVYAGQTLRIPSSVVSLGVRP